MVEGNFEFCCSEMLQNEGFSLISQRIFSPWLKEILNSAALKCSRMKEFHAFFSERILSPWLKNF
jgi:hypothetical protein